MKAQYRENEKKLRELVEGQGLQLHKVAEILGVHWSTVNNWCRRFGLQTHRSGPRTGVACKGGRFLGKGGYAYIFLPDHPNHNNKGYVIESRVIMEKKLGRYLDRKEVVHHLDKNPLNNHPDNLSLFRSNSDHLRHELTGKCPNWTPEGKKKLIDLADARKKGFGTDEDRKKQRNRRSYISRRRKAGYDDPQPLPTDHLIM
jgi:hypothetical protein